MTDVQNLQDALDHTSITSKSIAHLEDDDSGTNEESQKINGNGHTGNEHISDDDEDAPDNNTDVAPTPIGIAAEPSNFQVKHPLQNKWSLWYDNPGKKATVATWGDQLKRIVTFDSVEDFWRVYNNIKPASGLQPGSNYHLFKETIEPKWEDPHNSKGGKWIITVPIKNRRDLLDQIWLYSILACIGEALEYSDEVCGIVVSVRKQQDRLQLWTQDANNEVAIKAIGRHLKATLELPENFILGYQNHSDSLKRNSSFNNKNRYEV
jgi:translation initiation factor 4E